jgi:thymidylate synthase ThyX
MKVTALALIPPTAAENNPKVTPELLASCLAKYSRSNKGIQVIHSTIDWTNPDAAVENIFKFVDYGHASIGGLTGSIAIAVDDCSMLLAMKIFEFAQLSDGQESSTRYITMKPESLMPADAVGIPNELKAEWQSFMTDSFQIYAELYEQLDAEAQEQPELMRIPANTEEKVKKRLRKNYALDRARYLIPLATKTNAAYVMTARVWAETIRRLDAMDLPEAKTCAQQLRSELEKFAPRLIRHSRADAATTNQLKQELEASRSYIARNGVNTSNLADQVFVSVDRNLPDFMPDFQNIAQAFGDKTNRYSLIGQSLRRIMVRFAWNNIAIAELRDLNRHRSGHRFTPLCPVGFYLPEEVKHPKLASHLERQAQLIEKLSKATDNGAHLYAYLLGVQTPFEHSTHADKFIYEVELRTGMGAHFRYAEHLASVCEEFLKQMPELREYIEIGMAEPE